jgi:hypothetical protein
VSGGGFLSAGRECVFEPHVLRVGAAFRPRLVGVLVDRRLRSVLPRGCVNPRIIRFDAFFKQQLRSIVEEFPEGSDRRTLTIVHVDEIEFGRYTSGDGSRPGGSGQSPEH